jgi:hypothetical protein
MPFTAEQEDGSLVPTLVARLETNDPAYFVWIELHADREFGTGDDPGLILYAFDPLSAADLSTPTEMLGVWSVPAADIPAATA